MSGKGLQFSTPTLSVETRVVRLSLIAGVALTRSHPVLSAA